MSFPAVFFGFQDRGTARAADPVVAGTPLGVWGFDETSGGTVADSVSGNTGVGVSLERNLSPLLADGGKSAAGDGVTSAIEIAHRVDYQQSAYTLIVRGQADTLPAVSANRNLCNKDGGPGTPGRVSIEYYNDAGTGRIRAYTGNAIGTAVFVGASTGVGTLPVNTGFLVVLGVDPTDLSEPAQLWLWKAGEGSATKVATSTNAEGLQNNLASIWLMIYRGLSGAFDGVIDKVELRSGRLSQVAINALSAPVTITHGGSAPPEFTCLVRSTGTLINTHKNLGTLSAGASTRSLNSGGDAKYDLTGTIFTSSYNGAGSWTNQFAFRFTASHGNTCCSGGAFKSNVTANQDWGTAYNTDQDGGHIFIKDVTITSLLVEGFRCHGGWDPFRIGSGVGGSNWTMKGCWFTLTRDDLMENDNRKDGVVIDDCLVDGCFQGLSSRNPAALDGSAFVTIVRNNLIRLQPMSYEGGMTHGQFFKYDVRSPRLDLINNIFYVAQAGFQPTGDPFRDPVLYNKIRNSSGNTIIWRGSGSYPWTPPTGCTVVTTEATWTAAVAAWKTAHPLVQRLTGID